MIKRADQYDAFNEYNCNENLLVITMFYRRGWEVLVGLRRTRILSTMSLSRFMLFWNVFSKQTITVVKSNKSLYKYLALSKFFPLYICEHYIQFQNSTIIYANEFRKSKDDLYLYARISKPNPCYIEEGWGQKPRQRSSQLFGGKICSISCCAICFASAFASLSILLLCLGKSV